jgi:hypothetical protein
VEVRDDDEVALVAAEHVRGLVHATVCTTLAKMFAWVSIAPFGVPVVPPVYCRTARSSGAI